MSAHDAQPVRVALLEDNEELLELLRRYVNQSPGLICVGVYLTGEDALRELPLLQPPPDVVVVDLHLPGVSGVLCLELLRLKLPGVKLVVLSGEQQRDYVLAATRAGADGYLTKPTDRPQLARAIADAMAGRNPVSATVAGHLMAAVAAGPAGAFRPQPQLTDRENEVLRWLVEGLGNKEIADRLGLSISTVNAHLHSIYTKLGVQNRVEAVRLATRG